MHKIYIFFIYTAEAQGLHVLGRIFETKNYTFSTHMTQMNKNIANAKASVVFIHSDKYNGKTFSK
jgi:hypothetical protein